MMLDDGLLDEVAPIVRPVLSIMSAYSRAASRRRILARRLLAVLVIAALQATAFLSAFAAAFARADGGVPVSPVLSGTVAVLGTPALFIVGPRMQGVPGDPLEIVVAAGVGGLLWGGALVAL